MLREILLCKYLPTMSAHTPARAWWLVHSTETVDTSGPGGLPLAVQRPLGQTGGHAGGSQPQWLRWWCFRGQEGVGHSLWSQEENPQNSGGEYRQYGAETTSKVRAAAIAEISFDFDIRGTILARREDPSLICLQYSLFGVLTFR